MTSIKYELRCQAPDCGKMFLASKAEKQTCSPKCHMRLKRHRYKPLPKKKVCLLPHCQEVITTKIKRGRPQLYCCDEHMKRDYYNKSFGMTNSEKKGECPNPICDNPQFIKHHGRQIYCSDKCRVEHVRIKKQDIKIYGKNLEPQKNDDLPSSFCNYCGDAFQHSRSTAQFCTTSCRVMFNKQDRMAEWVHKHVTYDEESYFEDVLDGEIFIECEFNDVDFSGKSLTKAKFIRCVINNCDFTKSYFDGVELIDTDFEGYNTFSGAMIRFTKFPALVEEVLDLRGAIVSKMLRREVLRMHCEKLETRRISHYE